MNIPRMWDTGNPWVRISHTVSLPTQPIPVQPWVWSQQVTGTVLHETHGADGTHRSSQLTMWVKNLFRNLIKFNKNLFMWWVEGWHLLPPLPLLVSVHTPACTLPGRLFVAIVPTRLLICVLTCLCRSLLPHHACHWPSFALHQAFSCSLVRAGPWNLVALVWPWFALIHAHSLVCA